MHVVKEADAGVERVGETWGWGIETYRARRGIGTQGCTRLGRQTNPCDGAMYDCQRRTVTVRLA